MYKTKTSGNDYEWLEIFKLPFPAYLGRVLNNMHYTSVRRHRGPVVPYF